MAKFTIQSGITPSRRGPRAIYAKYEELYPFLPKMKSGDSIKITEVSESKRNSAYSSIRGVLYKEFARLEGYKENIEDYEPKLYSVRSTKLANDKVEIRVFRHEDTPKKKKK